jgi:CRP/FNR family transcriptional regulator, cyclic AMP receptor protein
VREKSVPDGVSAESSPLQMGTADAAISAALERSVFAGLPRTVIESLLASSRHVSVAPGHHFLGSDQPAPYRSGLVVSGLLRMYLESADGRQITIRYAGPGYFLGAALIVAAEGEFPPTGVQAITAARLVYLNQTHVRAAAHTDSRVSWSLLDQVVQYQLELTRLLAGTAFGSIRQRTAMHLLNLGIARSDGALVAPVTQQALADAVGTTRETVARALGELRRAEVIATVHGGILLRDVDRLASEAQYGSGV